MIKHIIDAAKGKHPISEKRSSQWVKARKEHLEKYPTCAVCGGKSDLEVHHIVPFHKNRSKELDPSNLITLCESKKNGVNCHLLFGHLGNFKSWNKDVSELAGEWLKRIMSRPLEKEEK